MISTSLRGISYQNWSPWATLIASRSQTFRVTSLPRWLPDIRRRTPITTCSVLRAFNESINLVSLSLSTVNPCASYLESNKRCTFDFSRDAIEPVTLNYLYKDWSAHMFFYFSKKLGGIVTFFGRSLFWILRWLFSSESMLKDFRSSPSPSYWSILNTEADPFSSNSMSLGALRQVLRKLGLTRAKPWAALSLLDMLAVLFLMTLTRTLSAVS